MTFSSVGVLLTDPCYTLCGGLCAKFLDLACSQNSLRHCDGHPYGMAVPWGGGCHCPLGKWCGVGRLGAAGTNTEALAVLTFAAAAESLTE